MTDCTTCFQEPAKWPKDEDGDELCDDCHYGKDQMPTTPAEWQDYWRSMEEYEREAARERGE